MSECNRFEGSDMLEVPDDARSGLGWIGEQTHEGAQVATYTYDYL